MATGELAVVTGAASGVGREVVARLLDRGCVVVGVDRSWNEESRRAGLIQVSGDVGSAGTWDIVAQRVSENPDLVPSMLVINAAKLVVGSIIDVDEKELRDTLAVNVWGAVRAVKTCLPDMVERGSGRIVAVASVDAMFAEQDLAAYCISKAALLQLVRTVAVDFGRYGIRANTVCPGAIDTPFFRQHVEAADDPVSFLAQKTARYPSGRILQPQDVAAAVVYLLSEDAIGVNGAHLMVDGGLTATSDYRSN